MSITAGAAEGFLIRSNLALVFFNLMITTTAARAADLAVVRFTIDNKHLNCAGSYPYNFVCRIDGEPSMYIGTYSAEDTRFLKVPMAVPANGKIRLFGVSLMVVDS